MTCKSKCISPWRCFFYSIFLFIFLCFFCVDNQNNTYLLHTRALDVYLGRLDVIRELFAFGSGDLKKSPSQDQDDNNYESVNRNNNTANNNKTNSNTSQSSFEGGPTDLESVLKKLNTCQTNIFKLEQKVGLFYSFHQRFLRNLDGIDVLKWVCVKGMKPGLSDHTYVTCSYPGSISCLDSLDLV